MVGYLSILMGFWVAPQPIKSIPHRASGLEATQFTPCFAHQNQFKPSTFTLSNLAHIPGFCSGCFKWTAGFHSNFSNFAAEVFCASEGEMHAGVYAWQKSMISLYPCTLHAPFFSISCSLCSFSFTPHWESERQKEKELRDKEKRWE